jgi:mycothiol S-conjugate amidase
MAVHAHPDDESSKGAATTARYAAEGADVLVVTCTGGERGSVLNPGHPDPPSSPDALARVRREEMAAAARALGVRHTWLGFADSGLPEGDPLPPLPDSCFASMPLEEATAPLVQIVREFRPHVVTTYDPTGGYPHPDHLMCHKVAFEAYHAAGDRERYRNCGAPWQPLKLYYDHAFSLRKIRTVHEALIAEGMPSPYGDWIESREMREIPEREVTTRVRAVGWFAARDAALLAHRTQVDPNGFFFAVPRELEARIWPVEEFELAHAHVPVTIPEDDLFAGIHPEDDG